MKTFDFIVEESEAGIPVKKLIKARFRFSSRLMTKIKYKDLITVNGSKVPGWYPVNPGDQVSVMMPEEQSMFPPEDIPIDVLYEDEDLLIINKQAGVTVHPTKGHKDHTIANGLMKYMEDTNQNFKVRFVNRLDMDTTGVLVIGKNSHAQAELIKQMDAGETEKKYLALVYGHLDSPDIRIDMPIGRLSDDSPLRGIKPLEEGGYPSLTLVHAEEYFSPSTDMPTETSLLSITLLTGRTHQIRVHLSSINHPIVGDPLYISNDFALAHQIIPFPRQALHAASFSFNHPVTKERLKIEAPLPNDFSNLIDMARLVR